MKAAMVYPQTLGETKGGLVTMEPMDCLLPAEAETSYYRQPSGQAAIAKRFHEARGNSCLVFSWFFSSGKVLRTAISLPRYSTQFLSPQLITQSLGR